MFGIFKKKSVPETPNNVFHTDVGMLGFWNYSTYQHIEGYATWESEFVEDEDIVRNIKNATYVPINIQSDGVFCVEVKLHEAATLSEREQKYLMVASQPYLLNTDGKISLSGMEAVGKEPAYNVKHFNVDPGEYVIQVHLISWDQEPGSKGSDGKPTENALPDFIVFVFPNDGTVKSFRQEVETFRHEDMA